MSSHSIENVRAAVTFAYDGLLESVMRSPGVTRPGVLEVARVFGMTTVSCTMELKFIIAHRHTHIF